MKCNTITVNFEQGFNGETTINNQKILIGGEYVRPYDMTLTAIASCLYATFLDELEQDNIVVTQTKIVVDGEKRETIPSTLEEVNINFSCISNGNHELIKEAFYRACKNCSMFQTIKHVADMLATIDISE